MSSSRALYEQVILDHNKNPRNFKVIEDADRKVEGFNPLCGDHITVYLKVEGDTIADIGIQGSGCAIAKSSASIMSTALKGKKIEEARAIFDRFHGMITAEPDAPVDEAGLGKLIVFSGVREYPIRIKCATLAWHALVSALNGEGQPISTE